VNPYRFRKVTVSGDEAAKHDRVAKDMSREVLFRVHRDLEDRKDVDRSTIEGRWIIERLAAVRREIERRSKLKAA
jgi:hypothetical protein